MTLFAVYDDEGRISQASKVYNPEGYSDLLHEHDLKHVAVRTSRLISPDVWHVRNDRVKIRDKMPITVSKTTVKAGDNDEVVFTGIPKGAQFKAATGGFVFQEETIPATELEYSIPVPCICRVSFELWPYQTFTVDLEVVA